MRQGELLGLKWEDIDMEAATLHVQRTLSTAMGKGFSFNPPKTSKSRRSIRIPKLALHTLRRHRAGQLEERMKVAGLWQDHDLVFTTGVGTPISRGIS
jgi:integrase